VIGSDAARGVEDDDDSVGLLVAAVAMMVFGCCCFVALMYLEVKIGEGRRHDIP
jgi:hypothetical protein